MSDRDLLISRIVDREDRPADWDRFDGILAADQGAAGQLLAALRDESLLRSAVGEAVAVADRVAIDAGRPARRRSMVHWGGWMAAAVLALIWMATDPRMKRSEPAPSPGDGARTAGGVRVDSGSSEADPAAVPVGAEQFVRALPHVMVEARPIPGSDRTEVLYVRRVLERAVVSGAYAMAVDEIGRPVQVQADLTRFAQSRRY